jgi:hypothetical protein
MIAVETAYFRQWHQLWLEKDFLMVTLAFRNLDMVPLQLRNCWLNCVDLTKKMVLIICHIFREENQRLMVSLILVCLFLTSNGGILYLVIYVMFFLETKFVFPNIYCAKFWSNTLFFPSPDFSLWVIHVRFLMRQL